MTDVRNRPVVVVKIGGSVLRGEAGYARAADWLQARLASESADFVVVVSAEYGHTDTLQDEAARICAAETAAADEATVPDAALLDLLWSTGELRSVALLALRLKARGERATGLSVHEVGLTLTPGRERAALNPLGLRAALAAHRVVVVPGFLATRAHRITTLGRGGSDWSAVLLAASLGAARCELIKDVDGYFTADPHTDAAAVRMPALSYATALAMADAGCPLVQRQAIAEAEGASLPLVIRSLTSHGTVLGAPPAQTHSPFVLQEQ